MGSLGRLAGTEQEQIIKYSLKAKLTKAENDYPDLCRVGGSAKG